MKKAIAIVNGSQLLSDDLTLLASLSPRYIFFPHWSKKIPPEIYKKHECILFHMTDLPYGRGGTPLQNLITRGREATTLTAFRVTEEIDAGPVYLKRHLRIDGTAGQIYKRAYKLSLQMMEDIMEDQTIPRAQEGSVTTFKRRTPPMSRIPRGLDARSLYDYIRMLDADEYPLSFLRSRGYVLRFTESCLEKGVVTAKVTFDEAKHTGSSSSS